MESWQIVLASITGFITISATLFFIPTVRHMTRKESDLRFEKIMQDVKDNYVTSRTCDQFHATQDVRNTSFTNTMVEIKEEIKEIRKDIKEAISHLIK
jgi:hypothetical protein